MNEIREDLKAFVDGELSPSRMAEVQAALDADPALKQEAEYMRMLGFEIKKLAADPAVAGKEAAVSKVRKPLAPWWDTSRLTGRLAYAGVLFLCLAGVSAILFPVFAQSKESAKRTAAMSAAKQERLKWEMASSDADAPAAAPADSYGGAGAPEFRSNPTATRAPGEEGGEMSGTVLSESELNRTRLDSGKSSTTVAKTKERTTAQGNRRSQPVKDASGSTGATKLPDALPSNRMVIKNADISLKVDDAKKALTDAEQLAKSHGGYTEGTNHVTPTDGTPTANVVLRVPASRYEATMATLRGYGEVLSESSNAQDVTAQHADVTGRLTVLRAEEDSYVTMLRGARKIGELMEIKDRLSQVRQEIASLQSQAKALQNESALSTIRATFSQKESIDKEKETEKSGFDETWAKAVNGLSAVGTFLGNLVIYLFVFSPVWLPPVLLFWWLSKKAKAV